MSTTTKKVIHNIGIFLVALCIGFAINYAFKKTDTQIVNIPVHDTVMIDSTRIHSHTKIIYVDRIDTFYILTNSDTVYITELPIDHKEYNDTISTDSTSTELNIKYHGFSAGIDSIYLKHNYYKQKEIVKEQPKVISPFLYLQGGPIFDSKIQGATLGIGGGIYIKNSWGVGCSYNINIRDNIDHSVQIQVHKKF